MRRNISILFFIIHNIGFTQDTLSICSFNIQFLGNFKNKDNVTISKILKPFDIVVIQELVAPPFPGKFPNNTPYKVDEESKAFYNEMKKQGFACWLSTEDTGPTNNHVNSTASEWWVIFYKTSKVRGDSTRFHGFVSQPLTKNANQDRVSYVFPLKTIKGNSTFSLIPVHLNPGDSKNDYARRQVEFNYLFNWTKKQTELNKDFIILGDCNVYEASEFQHFRKLDFYTLNDKCKATNTKIYESKEKGRPYDHIFYNSYLKQDIVENSFEVHDLKAQVMKVNGNNVIEPYNHDDFRAKYSDHLPISFKLITGKDTD
ncbi:MAG: endonuclease/exonuclease/phosphatase family protein [Bacteroidota bacterium]